MKLLVISDVHSNMNALRAVEAQEKTWDIALFAGDMVDFGLNPHEVVSWMRAHDVVAVAGNHDTALLKTMDKGFERLDDPYCAKSFGEHNLSLLTDEDLEYIRKLPLEITIQADGITYFMTHIYDSKDGYALLHHLEKQHAISAFESYWKEKVGLTAGKRCLVLGDTHHCMMVQLKRDAMILNPGAVGYNLGADAATKGASYILIENGVPYFRWADYSTLDEYNTVAEKMTNLDEWQYKTGLAIFKPEE